MTVVFRGVVRPSCLPSDTGGAVSASLPDDVESAVARSSTVAEGEDSSSESLSVLTRSVSKLVFELEPDAVSWSLSEVVQAHGLEVE